MPKKKQDWRLVALDETYGYEHDKELIEKTGRIFTVYMYRHDEVTHCCEITPSYYLIPIDYFTEKGPDIEDEEEKDRLYTILQEATSQSDPIYVHCSSIDRMKPRLKGIGKVKYKHRTKFEDEEEAREFYQGNAML